jgi:hypothetical protein
MKRIFKVIGISVFIMGLPFSLIMAQKTEQKIKIITDDGSGKKVVMDTTFSGNNGPDSLKLKDGSVVYLDRKGKKLDRKEHLTVTRSSNGKDNGNQFEEVTVVNTDSLDSDHSENSSEVISSNVHGNRKYKIRSDRDTLNYVVSDNNDSKVEKTRFVIAKDGMVVTIEGNDEAKAKELAKEIELKLGVSNEAEKKETIKVESKKKITK